MQLLQCRSWHCPAQKRPLRWGGVTTISFDVDVPETAVVTKGISSASTTNELICQVFINNSDYTPVPELTTIAPVDVSTHKAKVEFKLVKGNKYAFIFWAQTSGTGYYNTSDLRSVKMNVENVKANDPKMDAFWATETLTATADPSTKTKTLLRALAQVNFGAETLDRSDALTVASSSITMKGVADTFHPFLGNKSTACDGTVDITFAENEAITDEQLKVADKYYDYLATAYVFAPKSAKQLADISATFKLTNGKTTTVSAPNAPYQGNFRTNILGDLLTVGSTWTITIDPGFKGGDIIYDAVSANLEKGGDVTLDKDYSVASGSIGVSISLGVTSTLNLNGKRFANENGKTGNKAALQVHGNLTINGDGEVYCEGGATNNAIIVEQGGKLVINGGTYSVGKASNGTSNATIYVAGPDTYGRTGNVKIYGGTFSAEEGSDGTPFVLNQSDDITDQCIFVYGGKFIGFNPAEVNDAHGAVTSYLAPGYKVTKIVDAYYVTAEGEAPVVPAAGQDEFEDLLSKITAGTEAEVNLAEGTYTIPATLPDGVTISGKDGAKVVIDGSATATVTAKNVTVSNVIVRGKGTFEHGSSLAIDAANCTVSGCKFERGLSNTYGRNIAVSAPAGSVTTIKDCDFRMSGCRGIQIWSVGEEVKIDNCLFDNLYPFNVDGDGDGKVTVTNSSLKGWTSYGARELVSFTNCTFGSDSLYGYGCVVPYGKTTFKDCTFSSDFLVSPSGSGTFTVEFVNCKYADGTPITSAIMDTEEVNTNASWIIDGVSFTY